MSDRSVQADNQVHGPYLTRLWVRFGVGLLVILAVVGITLFQNHARLQEARIASEAVSLLDRKGMLGQRIAFLGQQAFQISSAAATELAEAIALFEALDAEQAAIPRPTSPDDVIGMTSTAGDDARFIATARALLAAPSIAKRARLAQTLRLQERAIRPRIAELSRLHGLDHAAAIEGQIRIQNRLWLTVLLVGIAQMILVMLPAQIAINGTLRDLGGRIHRLRERQTALRRANADLLNRSLQDSASGLPSRVAALHMIDSALARTDKPLSLLLFSLSDPDELGAQNDAALLSMIAILQDEREEDDVLMRFGGNDVLLLTREDAGQVARHMARALSMAADLAPDAATCRCVIGIAIAAPETTARDLIEQATRAAAVGRGSGAGSIVTYGPDLQRADSDLARHAHVLREALATGAIGVRFSPQIRLSDGTIVGLVATPDCPTPPRGTIARDRITATAAREGLQAALDRAVWSAALNDIVQWVDAGLDVPPVSLEASPDTMADPRLLSRLMTHLTGLGLAPASIRIVTSVAIWSATAGPLARMNVERLRAVGIDVVPLNCGDNDLDLAGLVTLEAADVFLDPTMVDRLIEEPRPEALSAIVRMLTACGMAVGARDVPDAAMLTAVSRAGCTTAHGPAVGPTLSGEQMMHHLQQAATDPVQAEDRLLRA